MGIGSWLALIVILVLFALIAIWEIKLDEANYYYSCYKKQLYRDKASNFKCKGDHREICKQCPYHKNILDK